MSLQTNRRPARSRSTASRSHAVMNEPTVQAAASNPRRRRLQFKMRELMRAVLSPGLVSGCLALTQRQAVAREAGVAELARGGGVNSREPTLLCLALSKLLGER